MAAFPLDRLGNTPFNEATMVFTPKKLDREVNGMRCCEPGDVRPLSVVNTDNRLLAAAVRLRVAPLLAAAISPAQRGSPRAVYAPQRGRRGQRDACGQSGTRRCGGGICRLCRHLAVVGARLPLRRHHALGIAAGLPGLRRQPLGGQWLQDLSGRHDTFGLRRSGTSTSGVPPVFPPVRPLRRPRIAAPHGRTSERPRQGVRRRRRGLTVSRLRFRGCLRPALPRLRHDLGTATELAQDNVCASRRRRPWQLSEAVVHTLPRLGAASIRLRADYLGFVLGPEGADRMWVKAFARYEQRTTFWAQLGLSLHHSSLAYNNYVVSESLHS